MTPPERHIWLDGELVPWERATVHVLSHAMQRGALVFDFVSVHRNERGTAAFRLTTHLERFVRSCELLGLPLGHGLDELREATLKTVRANPGCRSIKISAYIGSIEVELVPQNDHVSVAIAAYDVVRRHHQAHSGPLPLGTSAQAADREGPPKPTRHCAAPRGQGLLHLWAAARREVAGAQRWL